MSNGSKVQLFALYFHLVCTSTYHFSGISMQGMLGHVGKMVTCFEVLATLRVGGGPCCDLGDSQVTPSKNANVWHPEVKPEVECTCSWLQTLRLRQHKPWKLKRLKLIWFDLMVFVLVTGISAVIYCFLGRDFVVLQALHSFQWIWLQDGVVHRPRLLTGNQAFRCPNIVATGLAQSRWDTLWTWQIVSMFDLSIDSFSVLVYYSSIFNIIYFLAILIVTVIIDHLDLFQPFTFHAGISYHTYG